MDRVFMEYGSREMVDWSDGLIEYLRNDNCAISKRSIEFDNELRFMMNDPRDWKKVYVSFVILQLEAGPYSALNLLAKVKGDWIRQEQAIKNVAEIFRKISKQEFKYNGLLSDCFEECHDAARDCRNLPMGAVPYFCCCAAGAAAIGSKKYAVMNLVDAADDYRKAKQSARINLIQAIKGA